MDYSKYRLLKIGETIEFGDEVKSAGSWVPCRASVGSTINEWRCGDYEQGYYRRSIGEVKNDI